MIAAAIFYFVREFWPYLLVILMAVIVILFYRRQPAKNKDRIRGYILENKPRCAGISAAVLLGVGLFLYFATEHNPYSYRNTHVNTVVTTGPVAQDTTQKESAVSVNPAESAADKKLGNSQLKKAENELKKYGITENVVSTSFGHQSNGFLAKLDNGDLYVVDVSNSRAAKITPPDITSKIGKDKSNGQSVKAEAKFLIFNDAKDSDRDSGFWQGDNHLLPVIIEYKFKNGKHVPYMINSGSGASPVSYDNYLYEQKNVDIVNLLVEEASAL